MTTNMASASLGAALRAARQAEACADWDLVVSCYHLALGIRPNDFRLLANLGNAHWLADRAQAAHDAYEAALELAPDEPLLHLGLANALRDLNRFERADAAYARCRSLRDSPLSAWNHSQLLLGLERYATAFAAAEERLAVADLRPYRRASSVATHPSLAGEPTDTPLRIWTEQGFGDSLQYVRWLVPLCQRPNAITLEVEPCLLALLQRGLAWLPYPPAVVAKLTTASATPGEVISHASLLSLPHRCGGAPLPMPTPYLHHPSWEQGPWSADRPARVGLVWAAGRKLDDPFTAREYRKRSLASQQLGQLVTGLVALGVQVTNLQVGADRAMADPLQPLLAEALPPTADFAATAAVVCGLDLVITVDTAMAHLAGALGLPTWVLLPWSADPRWLRDRSDSPWYPSLRLWRQPQPSDWSAVISAVLEAWPAWWQARIADGFKPAW